MRPPAPLSPDPHATADDAAPRFAVLFWFFKAFEVCRTRVEALRRLNPGVPIYGLYGGPPEEADAARAALEDALDDLHVYAGAEDSYWKWIHGDQLIADWFARRGHALPWDAVLVVQWDLLVAAPLAQVLAPVRRGEAVFTGERPLAEVIDWWGWGGLRGGPVQVAAMAEFRAWLDAAGYAGPLRCCLFITAVLPRRFLQAYVDAGPPAPGFLEYKLPTLAGVFGVPVRTAPQLQAWWRSDPLTADAPACERVLNATREPVPPEVIAAEMARPDGRRVFHPVSDTTPWG